MDYEALLKLDAVENLYKTERGSTYAQHSDATSTRNRSGAGHADKTEGLQPRSGKTVYMTPENVNRIGGYFQNPDMASKFIPVLDNDGKPTGKAAIDLMQDYGPKKAGTRLVEAPYETRPKVGLSPVEIYGNESKIGDTGRNIHFGNKITEVVPVNKSKSGGGGGGGGGADLGMKGIGKNQFKNYAKGGSVKMPKEYSKGNWKLI